MALFFMDCDCCFFFVRNKFYDQLLSLFTVAIKDGMLLTKVHKSVPRKTKSFGKYKSNIVCAAELVYGEEILDA